jgi:predicted dehydrogenase
LRQEHIRRVHDGAIGDVMIIRAYFNMGQLSPVHPRPEWSEMEYQLRNWGSFTWLGGDHYVEQHVHNLDVAYWILGKPPLKAHGMGGREVRSGREQGEIFDHFAVEFTYDDDVKVFSQAQQINGCFVQIAEFAHGTKGTADLNRGSIRGANRWRYRGEGGNPYQIEQDVLVDAIRNDKPHNEAEQGALSTMLAVMGRMAAYSGKQITWDEAFNSQRRLGPEKMSFDAEPPVLPGAEGDYPTVAIPGMTNVL